MSAGSVVKNPPANAEDVGSSLGREDPLEKEMAAHTNILAQKIPWMEEPGRLQSTESQWVRHDLKTKQQQQTNHPVMGILVISSIFLL